MELLCFTVNVVEGEAGVDGLEVVVEVMRASLRTVEEEKIGLKISELEIFKTWDFEDVLFTRLFKDEGKF